MIQKVAPIYNDLCSRVRALHFERKRTDLLGGVCLVVMAAMGPFLAALIIDRFLPLPLTLRILTLVGCAGLSLFFLVRNVAFCGLRRFDTVATAEFIESRLPELNTSLITAIQIYPDLERQRPWFDPQMVVATLHYTAGLINQVNLFSIIDTDRLRKRLAVAGGILLAAIIYAATDLQGFLNQLDRFLGVFTEARQEWSAAAKKDILVKVLPDGKTTVLVGSEVTLEATLVGFTTDSLKLAIQPKDSEPEEISLDAGGKSVVTHTLRSVERSFDAVFSSGEVVSTPVSIKVVEKPEVVNIQLECIYPAYCRRTPMRLPRSSGEITALMSSHVVLTIEANKSLQSGLLKIEGGKLLSLAVGGRFARAVVTLEEPTEYRISLTDSDSFSYEDADPRMLKVVYDQAPEIAFVNLGIEPEAEVQLTEGMAAGKPLEVSAKDDYGIRKILFHYDVEAVVKELYHEPLRDQQRPRSFSIPRQTWTGMLARAGELGLKVGDRLSFWAEVQDWYDGGGEGTPHTARTPVYHLVVVGEEFAWEDVEYRPDEAIDFSLYDSLKRKARGRSSPPRESITREDKPAMPELELELPYGHEEVPIQYQRAWKAYTGSLME